MKSGSKQVFGIPADGYAIFGHDGGEGYVHRRGLLTVRVVGETHGSVWGAVRLLDATGAVEIETAFRAKSFAGFQRAFQAMVALGHDGGPDEAVADWTEDAFWVASVPWSLDDSAGG